MATNSTPNTPKRNLTEEELDDHKIEITKLVGQVSTLSVPANQKDKVGRFVRDCNTLIKDLDEATCPSAHDLSDFGDRRNSLEVQYFNITEDLS